MQIFKKVFKIICIVIFLLFIGLLVAAHVIMSPKSDERVLEKLENPYTQPYLYYNKYKNFNYRVIAMQQVIDTTLPTLVFVHGSPGATLDYKKYFKDSTLLKKANILGYDRIGYGVDNVGDVQGSIALELEVLHDVIKELPLKKVILIGYSYGGSVVLASPKKYKYKVSLASAISADLEPMFWTLNFYNWRLTRWLIPKKIQAAAKEKYFHLTDLPNYENKWNKSLSPVVNIHGDKDWIVPYKNSIILQELLDKDKFKMVTIKDGGHELIWSDFELIKNEILKLLE